MFDYHLHTHISFDSSADVGEMIMAAKKAGLREICFTDHCDYFSDPKLPPNMFSLESYRTAYDALDLPGITVRRGVEFGMTEWNREALYSIVDLYPFDFVIGSVHMVDNIDPHQPEYWHPEDVEGDFRRYLEQCLKCVQIHDGFDVLGHLTYVCKSVHNPRHAPIPFPDYQDITDAIMEELVRKDIGMEINTSGVDRAGDFLPSADFLRRYKELGGRIVTVGSDAHTPGRVGQYIPQALEILKDIFGYVCTFHNRQPVFHKL